MAGTIREAEILSFLREVEFGRVVLTPCAEPQEVYAGNVEYAASNGWRITIFNDANEWDYVDSVRSADGRSCNYDEIFDTMEALDGYRPAGDLAWQRYGLPGHGRYRCVQCGLDLAAGGSRTATPPFRCAACRKH